MYPTIATAVLALVFLLGPLVILLPIYRFLRTGWSIKRSEILDGFDEEACEKHLRMFQRSTTIKEGCACALLRKTYEVWYGRRNFAWPVIVLAAVSLVASFAAVTSAVHHLGHHEISERIVVLPMTALAAIAGSYIFVANDFTTRARRLDFMPSDVHWGVLRITASIPLGYAFAILTGRLGPAAFFVAFAAAAFPLELVERMIRRQFPARLKEQKNRNNDDIIKLQGVNNDIATRLAHEDVTTITQMAYCDPIRLTMRSGLSFNFVVDCMSQALAWEYIERDMNVVRRFGLRGAVEFGHLYRGLHDDARKGQAVKIIDHLVESLNKEGKPAQTCETVTFMIEQVALDPFTTYLESVWTGPPSKCEEKPLKVADTMPPRLAANA